MLGQCNALLGRAIFHRHAFNLFDGVKASGLTVMKGTMLREKCRIWLAQKQSTMLTSRSVRQEDEPSAGSPDRLPF